MSGHAPMINFIKLPDPTENYFLQRGLLYSNVVSDHYFASFLVLVLVAISMGAIKSLLYSQVNLSVRYPIPIS